MPPSLTQPPNVWIVRGESTTLTVVATGTNLSYAWYQGNRGVKNNPIAYTASVTVTPSDTTVYWVEVSNLCGTDDSAEVVVHVCAPPTITAHPARPLNAIYNGATVALSVAATANSSEVLAYQWYTGASGDTSAPVAGATAATLTTPPLTVTTSFWARVFGGSGCNSFANSEAATVTVCPYTETVGSPSTIFAAIGQTTHLTSPVTGSRR